MRVSSGPGRVRRGVAVGLMAGAALALAGSRTASAQSLDAGVELYQQQAYPQAATSLFNTMQRSDNREERERAQIYLAEALRQKELYVAAVSYYANILKAGSKGAHFLNAVEGLLAVQEALHDPLLVPLLLTRALDGASGDDFPLLEASRRAQINYLVGDQLMRQHKHAEAQALLERVTPMSPLYVKATYLLGVLAIRAGTPERALDLFQGGLAALDNQDSQDRQDSVDPHGDVRNLTLLALGRTLYGLKRFAEADEAYGKVPRYSDAWFTALSENSWSHFQKLEYGKTLGDVQTLVSPFFNKRHRPEAYVLAATTYFANCQWDRVRGVVDRYKRSYEPLAAQLDGYLKSQRDPADYVRDVALATDSVTSSATGSATGSASAALPAVFARRVRDSRRFEDLYFVLRHVHWERDELQRITAWHGTRLVDALRVALLQYQDKIEPAMGGWVRTQLVNELVTLQSLTGQINIVDFEVSDAERRWLEGGREILKGRRARLPRPAIPSDSWQHWSFAREVWKDELGAYQFAIRTECD